jgi:hypothetical protein
MDTALEGSAVAKLTIMGTPAYSQKKLFFKQIYSDKSPIQMIAKQGRVPKLCNLKEALRENSR